MFLKRQNIFRFVLLGFGLALLWRSPAIAPDLTPLVPAIQIFKSEVALTFQPQDPLPNAQPQPISSPDTSTPKSSLEHKSLNVKRFQPSQSNRPDQRRDQTASSILISSIPWHPQSQQTRGITPPKLLKSRPSVPLRSPHSEPDEPSFEIALRQRAKQLDPFSYYQPPENPSTTPSPGNQRLQPETPKTPQSLTSFANSQQRDLQPSNDPDPAEPTFPTKRRNQPLALLSPPQSLQKPPEEPTSRLESPQVALNFQYYEIEGQSIPELLGQMRIHAPSRRSQDIAEFAAQTEWHVRWKYDYTKNKQGCTLKSPFVKVKVSTTLPRWQKVQSERSGVEQEWQRYLEALSTHEAGHQRNGISAGTAIQQLLQAHTSDPSCPALIDKMNKAARTVIEDYRRKDRDYDRLTQHGLTQGATLKRGIG